MGKNSSKICKTIGSKPGLVIWRIDSITNVLKAAIVEIKKYEEFQNDKCYVILHTKDQEEVKGKWQIHIWVGDEAVDNEIEIAKQFVIELWNNFDKNATQYKERKNRESKIFLNYFNGENENEPELATCALNKKTPSTPTSLNILKIVVETVILQLIYLGLYAVQSKLINDYIPTVPHKELVYEYIPILKQYVPDSRNLEIIAFSSLYIWTAITVCQCFMKCCSPKTKCCCVVGLLKKNINFLLVLATVFLVQSGMLFDYRNDLQYKDLVLERLGLATFSLWAVIFGLRII